MLAQFIVSVLAAAAPEPGSPAPSQALLIDVGLVRVSPLRPGTNKPWDQPVAKPERNGCKTLGFLVGLFATPGAGAVAGGLCGVAESADGNGSVMKHSPEEPDIFVRVVPAPGVSYRSYTVRNTHSHVFHFRSVVLTETIPSGWRGTLRPE